MLENLLVCLRHCCEEIRKRKGFDSASVVYLHQFQYHILVQGLKYFHEDVSGGGRFGGGGEGYVPTLPSSAQPPGNVSAYFYALYCVLCITSTCTYASYCTPTKDKLPTIALVCTYVA